MAIAKNMPMAIALGMAISQGFPSLGAGGGSDGAVAGSAKKHLPSFSQEDFMSFSQLRSGVSTQTDLIQLLTLNSLLSVGSDSQASDRDGHTVWSFGHECRDCLRTVNRSKAQVLGI